MPQRRKVLKSIAGAVGYLSISGCIFNPGDESTSTPMENAGTPTSSSTATTTESPTSTATGTPSPTERTPPTATESADLRLENHTETEHALTLEVAPESGGSVTDSWILPAKSSIKEDIYEPLDSAATISASVEGYETVTYDWSGDEPGKTLGVTIMDSTIEIQTYIV